MSYKNFFNLRENKNFLFNLLLCLALLQNFDFYTKNLIIIIFLIIIFYNYKNISLKNKALLPLFFLITYLIFIYLFNSIDLLLFLLNIKFWFTFLFVILVYQLLNLNFTLNIFVFRFFLLLLILEFVIFNFFSNYSNIFITQNSDALFFGFHRVIGFARNTSVSASTYVCLFVYFYQRKIIKPLDWICLFLGLIVLFSSTSFLLITLFFFYFLLSKTNNKIKKIKKLIVLFFLILVMINMPIKQETGDYILKKINYQKISKSYYVDNAFYKFNHLLCKVFEIQPIFNYKFSDNSLKTSYTCFIPVKINHILGTSFTGNITRGGDFGWLDFYLNFGIVGLFVVLLSLRIYKINNQLYLILLVILSSFHYFTLANIFTVIFFAMIFNEKKLKNNDDLVDISKSKHSKL
jgi:hypothetical protein